MKTAQETATKWVCDGCGVCVSQMNGEHTAMPQDWARSEDGRFCLICRRSRAAEAALEAAGDITQQDRARLRRSALLEFEVSRTPDRSNGEIARTCRSSVPAVAAARERLDLDDPA